MAERVANSAEAVLAAVERGAGRSFDRVVFTRNRRVMASVAGGGRDLRVHQMFEGAPEDVLVALGEALRRGPGQGRARERIGDWMRGRLPAARRRPWRPGSADKPLVDRLQREFAVVNRDHFGGALPAITIRISRRMTRRNGHFNTDPLEIAISGRLCEEGAPGEAERTLRHEMIHLWQWMQGRDPGHGRDFRKMATRLGVPARATRRVDWVRRRG